METARQISELNAWIDKSDANAARDPEAATWGRLAKVAEEHGEVLEAYIAAQGSAIGRTIAAYIGFTGQNPRKGFVGEIADVRKELLDVALTALCAVEHLDVAESGRGPGMALSALYRHIETVHRRAGLSCADPILHRKMAGCTHER